MEVFTQTSKRFLLFKSLLNLFFPPNCAECGELILEEMGLCADCWQNLNYIEEPLCPRLGVPFAYDPGDEILSAEALARPPLYNSARFVAHYDGVAMSLIKKIKYHDQTYLMGLMGNLMVKMGQDVIRESDLIIPVPLHKRRLLARRFNQASLLAIEISKRSEIPIDHLLLTRTVPTRSQIGLTAKERKKNVAGAFHVHALHYKKLKGKTILLVDDVVTTGSTIEACAKTLLEAGAKSVNILGFARVTESVRTL